MDKSFVLILVCISEVTLTPFTSQPQVLPFWTVAENS